MSTVRPAAHLREVLSLLSNAVETIASEWEASPCEDGPAVAMRTVSHAEHRAVKTAMAAMGSLEDLIVDPRARLTNLAMSYTIARALHVAAKSDIAGLLAQEKTDGDGVHIVDLATSTGIEKGKLARIIRSLTSHHIFSEVSEDYFTNNDASRVLTDDEAFRAFVITRGEFSYSASDYLPDVLLNPAIGHSYEATKTAFQQAVRTPLPVFEWLQQPVPASDPAWRPREGRRHPRDDSDGQTAPFAAAAAATEMVPRPEKQLFHLAISGVSKSTENYYVHDFPWDGVGRGTVVDVGGGIGGFCMQLHAAYPDMHLVVQDQAPVVQQAARVWETRFPGALAQKRVELATHNFFHTNPVAGAAVYWLRHIVHDWADDEAVVILGRVAEAMGAGSRLLIADMVVHTTTRGSNTEATMAPAPPPLLANYGRAAVLAHAMDINMMMMANGRERTPAEFRRIIERAGLVLVKIWECRGPLSIVECRLREDSAA